MRLLTTLSQFLQDLQAQRLRTTLTILGITWGTVAVIVLLSFGVGLERQSRKNMHGMGDGIVVVFGGRTTKPLVGVMQPKTQNSSYYARDKDRIFIPASTFRALFGDRYVNNLVYRPADPDLSPAIKAQVFEVMGRKHRFDPSDDDALGVWDTGEFDKFLKYFFIGFNIFMGIIGSFTLTVGGIGVANIMYVVVRERTHEIGIKRSVGATRRDILAQFFTETFLIVGLGAALGFAAAYGLLSFGEGLGKTMRDGFLNAGDRIFMIYGGETSKAHDGLPEGRRIRLVKEDLALLQRSIPDVDLGSVSYGRWGTTLQVGRTKTTTFMEGVDPAFEEMRRMFPAQGGRFLNARDDARKRRVLFLGNEIAGRLFGAEDPVGREVLLDGLPFTVIGVMQEKLQTSMNNGPDANRAIIPASTYEIIYGDRYVDQIIVRPRDVQRAAFVKNEIFRVMSRRYKFDPTDERALPMWDFIEGEREGAKVFLGIQIFLGLVGGLTLLLAGVGVANIMYVTVKERTHEFGVKLAMGARRRHIKLQVTFEALLIALTGGALGLLCSALVVVAVAGIPNTDQSLSPPSIPWRLCWQNS